MALTAIVNDGNVGCAIGIDGIYGATDLIGGDFGLILQTGAPIIVAHDVDHQRHR